MSEFSPRSLARSKVSCGIATTAKTSFLDRATDKNVQGACHRRDRRESTPRHQQRMSRCLSPALPPALSTSTANVKVPVTGALPRLDIPVRVLASKLSKVESLVRHGNHCQDIISQPRDINSECQGACHRRSPPSSTGALPSPALSPVSPGALP